MAVLALCMAKPVKVPDPVYEEIKQKSEQQDVSMGVVVRDWMEQAQKYEEIERRQL